MLHSAGLTLGESPIAGRRVSSRTIEVRFENALIGVPDWYAMGSAHDSCRNQRGAPRCTIAHQICQLFPDLDSRSLVRWARWIVVVVAALVFNTLEFRDELLIRNQNVALNSEPATAGVQLNTARLNPIGWKPQERFIPKCLETRESLRGDRRSHDPSNGYTE